MSFLKRLVAKVSALFSSDYRELKDKVNSLNLTKKQIQRNSAKLKKELAIDLQRRIILKESVRTLNDIYNNLKYGASVVSLSEFNALRQDLDFNRDELSDIESKIKEGMEQEQAYSKELLDQTEQIKNVSQQLEKFGVLVNYERRRS